MITAKGNHRISFNCNKRLYHKNFTFFLIILVCFRCSIPDNESPAKLELSGQITHVSKFGDKDGSIDLSVHGGKSPYTFLWSNNKTTEDIDSLTAGTYVILVYDAASDFVSDTFLIIQPSPDELKIEYTLTPPDKYGAANGSIDISVTGGVLPYSFIWSSGETTEDIDSLTSGIYIITVSDYRLSELTDTFELLQPPIDAIYVTYVTNNPSVTGSSDGSIDITVTGGYPPYTFLWSNGSTHEDAENLPAGTFYVRITDNRNQCREDSISLSDELTDFDGNTYPIIKIGDQIWMGENLRTMHDHDGNPVSGYAYGNDESKVNTYGRLYTWTSAMNGSGIEKAQGICPCGWHIPSDEEFKMLEVHLGMSRLEADMENMWRGKGVGTSLIYGGNSGYNALLSGSRNSAGNFGLIDLFEYVWTSTEYGLNAWRRCLDINSDLVGRWNTFPKSYGFSVRCVKND